MKDLLFITPHLSTGGLPQYLLAKIQALSGKFNITVCEYNDHGNAYVVQRNQIDAICGRITLTEDKSKLIHVIKNLEPDIIHLEEMPEYFIHDKSILEFIYDANRAWVIVETTHTRNRFNKLVVPDKIMYASAYSIVNYPNLADRSIVWEYPIIPKERPNRRKALKELALDPERKHVLQVGLWSAHKNQAYTIALARVLKDVEFYFIGNTAQNFENYWGNLIDNLPSNCHVLNELADIDRYYSAMDLMVLPSIEELNPLVVKEALGWHLPVFVSPIQTLPTWYQNENNGINWLTMQVGKDAEVINNHLRLSIHPFGFTPPVMDNVDLFDFYNELEINNKPSVFAIDNLTLDDYKPEFIIKVDDGLYVEILNGKGEYDVRMIDSRTGDICHRQIIKTNTWIRSARKYYTPWQVQIWQDGEMIYLEDISLHNEKVFITINSTSLGDTIAWVPYVYEFAKEHSCKVILSTFWNQLFEGSYPDIQFVDPNDIQYGYYAHYRIGIFNHTDKNLHPNDPRIIPLQKIASDLLGLKFKEIKPIIHCKHAPKPAEKKYVVICTESTAGAKVWNNKGAWQEVVDGLIERGYEVRVIQKTDTSLIRIKDKTGEFSIHNRITEISGCEIFIGLSSGLSWLAWALNKPVVMISGFTEIYNEFHTPGRVINRSGCHSCWNNVNNILDPNNWNWCPNHEKTHRQFECSKNISSQQVLETFDKMTT